jgi:hypothetical protein
MKPIDDKTKSPPNENPEAILLENVKKLVGALPAVEGAEGAAVRAHALADAMFGTMEMVTDEEGVANGTTKEDCAKAKAALIIRDAFTSVAGAFASAAGLDPTTVGA